MNKTLLTGLFLSILAISACTTTKHIKPPQIVGPHIYELYTDAHFFITHVYVNGIKSKLSNAEGNGSIRKSGLRFSGAKGYPNKTLVNLGLNKGDNIIKVVYEPTPGLKKQKEQEARNIIIRDMYAHAVLTKGILKSGSFGVQSYDLDQLVNNKSHDIKIIGNKLLRRFNKDDLTKEVSITFKLTIPKTANIGYTKLNECDIDFRTSSNLSALVSLNGSLVRKITNNSGRIEGYFDKLVKKGENELTLNVISINKKADTNYIESYVSCDIKSAIKEVKFANKHQRLSFTDFFTHKRTTISRIEMPSAGVYTSTFKFSHIQ